MVQPVFDDTTAQHPLMSLLWNTSLSLPCRTKLSPSARLLAAGQFGSNPVGKVGDHRDREREKNHNDIDGGSPAQPLWCILKVS